MAVCSLPHEDIHKASEGYEGNWAAAESSMEVFHYLLA